MAQAGGIQEFSIEMGRFRRKNMGKFPCRHLTPKGIVEGNDPYLYGEKVKAYLIRGAKHLPILQEYPNPALGWGVLCLRDSLPG